MCHHVDVTESEERHESQCDRLHRILEGVADEDSCLFLLEDIFFCQDGAADTVFQLRYRFCRELAQILVSARRHSAVLVFMHSEVEFLLVCDDRLVQRRQQHVVVVVELRLWQHQQAMVFPCVTADYGRVEEGSRTVGAQNLLVHRELQIH